MALSYPSYRNTRKRKNTRNTRKKKGWVKRVMFGAGILLIVTAGFFLYSPILHYIDKIMNPVVAAEPVSEPLLFPYDVGTVRVDRFRDLNEIHVAYAKTQGIVGFTTEKNLLEGVDTMVKAGKLVKIADNDYYVLKELTHSHPYLTPGAAKLLDEIGIRFRKKLEAKGLDKCYFQISSLLRSNENQRRLSRFNSNASSNSSHLYATTFDIAYNKVIKKPNPQERIEVVDGPAMKLLSETIGELRKEGRCLAVTERREACFHITSTR
jgi:hypothetical protein